MITEEENYKTSNNPLAVESWDSYIGQEKVKERLQVKIKAAMERYEQMDAALILGQSGTGKSSIARLIADEHAVPFIDLMITPNFSISALNNILVQFDEDGGGIVFLDEIHNFSKKDQHYLYSILEDNCITYGAKHSGKRHYFVNAVTIIAATTDENLLTKALRGRFGAPYRLGAYSDKEMGQIVERMAIKIGLTPTIEECIALGQAAAGSPRQAGDLIKTARDLGSMAIEPILELAEITRDGLTVDHIAILDSIFNLGGITGLENITNHSGRAKDDIVDLEKLLVRKGFIEMTGKGRALTGRGVKALREARLKK